MCKIGISAGTNKKARNTWLADARGSSGDSHLLSLIAKTCDKVDVAEGFAGYGHERIRVINRIDIVSS